MTYQEYCYYCWALGSSVRGPLGYYNTYYCSTFLMFQNVYEGGQWHHPHFTDGRLRFRQIVWLARRSVAELGIQPECPNSFLCLFALILCSGPEQPCAMKPRFNKGFGPPCHISLLLWHDTSHYKMLCVCWGQIFCWYKVHCSCWSWFQLALAADLPYIFKEQLYPSSPNDLLPWLRKQQGTKERSSVESSGCFIASITVCKVLPAQNGSCRQKIPRNRKVQDRLMNHDSFGK